MADNTNNLPVHVDPSAPPTGMALMMAVLQGNHPAQPRRYCSLVPKTDAQRAAYIQALEGEGVSFDQCLNTELAITDVAFVRRTLADKATGEIYDSLATVLFTADGKHFGGSSGPVGRATAALTDLFGLPPWNPPVVVKIRAVTKGPEQRLFFLDFIRREETRGKKV